MGDHAWPELPSMIEHGRETISNAIVDQIASARRVLEDTDEHRPRRLV